MDKAIFKAYDIRGKYPEEINEEAVFNITEALASYFKRGKIIVGYDARLSSPILYKAVLKAIEVDYRSLTVIEAGMITTPMLYFLVNNLKAVGGIMVTASHNPKEYNGLKVIGPKAVPISGKEILKLLIIN